MTIETTSREFPRIDIKDLWRKCGQPQLKWTRERAIDCRRQGIPEEGKITLKMRKEMSEEVMIRDSAPGVDGIRALAIKSLDEDGGTKLYECVKELLAMKPDDWPSEVKEGWIIPLQKKGPKTGLNNYRGVCLLQLTSRVIARVYATRLRTWAEKTEALGENQLQTGHIDG